MSQKNVPVIPDKTAVSTVCYSEYIIAVQVY